MPDYRQETRHDASGTLVTVYVVEYLDDEGELREAELDFAVDAQEFADNIGSVSVRQSDGDEYTADDYAAVTEPPDVDEMVASVLDAVKDVPRRLAEASRRGSR